MLCPSNHRQTKQKKVNFHQIILSVILFFFSFHFSLQTLRMVHKNQKYRKLKHRLKHRKSRLSVKRVQLAIAKAHWHLVRVHQVAVAHWYHPKNLADVLAWSSAMRYVSITIYYILCEQLLLDYGEAEKKKILSSFSQKDYEYV